MNHKHRQTSAPTTEPSRHQLIDLSPRDAERIMTLEDLVWFDIAPGVSIEDGIADLDFKRTRGVEFPSSTPRLGAAPTTAPPLAGMYASWPMAVTVPGAAGALCRLPMNGLTWVGVHPDMRRQGLLRQMMTDHLHRAHEHGEAVAGLLAAEPGIYGRFGYGAASLDIGLTVSRGTEFTAGEAVETAAAQIRTHFVPAGTPEGMAAIQQAHLAAAEHTLGAVTRNEQMARLWFRDHPTARGAKEPLQAMFATRDGAPTGYALFRRTSNWTEDNRPNGTVVVRELGAVDAASLLALARRLVDVDLTSTVTFHGRGASDDPLLWWAGGPRQVKLTASDSLWVRLVDVEQALTARGYATAVEVVLDVTDPVCPWNQRRWRLTADTDGQAQCVPTDAEPDLQLPVSALGAAYLGSRPIAAQAAAGVVTERHTGAAAALSRAMRGDVEPVATIGF